MQRIAEKKQIEIIKSANLNSLNPKTLSKKSKKYAVPLLVEAISDIQSCCAEEKESLRSLPTIKTPPSME